MIDAALHALKVLCERRKLYDPVNRAIKDLQGDFHGYISPIDEQIEAAFVAVLDQVLGDGIAQLLAYTNARA